MRAISIVVAITHIPSHRTTRNKVEGGLLSSFTREQFEMQEVSELTCSHCLSDIKQCKTVYLSPSLKRTES